MTEQTDPAVLQDFGEALLAEPEAPEDWECCGSECGDYCIYEIYRRERQAFDEQQARLAQFLQSK